MPGVKKKFRVGSGSAPDGGVAGPIPPVQDTVHEEIKEEKLEETPSPVTGKRVHVPPPRPETSPLPSRTELDGSPPAKTAGEKPEPHKLDSDKVVFQIGGGKKTGGKNASAENHAIFELSMLVKDTLSKVEKLEQRIEAQKATLQNLVDATNALFVRNEALDARDTYLAWQVRLAEFKIAKLNGFGMNDDLENQARYQIKDWEMKMNQKLQEAQIAMQKIQFGGLIPNPT